MKKMLLLSALFLFVFSACEKNLYDEELAEAKKTIKDLVVPQDFDWGMTKKVTVTLTAIFETPACIYVNPACTDEYKAVDYTVFPGFATPIAVEVPAAINKLYVKYNGNTESIAINDGTAELKLAPSSRADTRAWDTRGNEIPLYVGKNWSTLMFEDMFPDLGDYDFNDFVANYRYDVVYVVSANNQGNLNSSHVAGYQFEFRVNAVGATKMLTPYLRVKTKEASLLDAFNTSDINIVSSSNPNIKIELVSSKSGERIFKFVGMTDKDPKQFLNTDPEMPLVKPVSFKAEVKAATRGTQWDATYTADVIEFDFFITNGTHEIHKRGFAPALGTYPASDIENGAGTEYYSNANNLIWVIDIPAVINHAKERENFLNAYPQFKSWATSKGQNNTTWYNFPDSKYLIDYMGPFAIN